MEMKRDVHLSGKDLMSMVQLRPGDLGKFAIVPGPLDRLNALIKKLKDPIKNFSFMEYNMYTGTIDGIKVSAGNGGRFSSDSAINAEILCNAGTENIIRIGSCGALDEKINIGDLIIVTDVYRGDGVTPYYVDKDFVTKADQKIIDVLTKACKKFGITCHLGGVWTTDALLKETKEIVGRFRKQGAIAVDMVCSSLLTIAQLYKVKAGAVLAVSDNIITGEMGFTNPKYYMSESMMLDISLEAVRILSKG